MGNYILRPDGELYHFGIKGMKWGVRRFQNKDGSLTPAGKKRRMTREQKDTRKLVDMSLKYYDSLNKYNALIDTKAVASDAHKNEIAELGRKTQALVDKMQKRYATVDVIPTFEENGYVVKSVEACVTKLDRLGRLQSINKSFAPVETYNSWRSEANPKRIKALDAVDAKYSKKMAAAKTDDERAEIEFDWIDELEKVEGRY